MGRWEETILGVNWGAFVRLGSGVGGTGLRAQDNSSTSKDQAWGCLEGRDSASTKCFPSVVGSAFVPEAAVLTRGSALALLSTWAEEMKGRSKILALSQEINWLLLKNAACCPGQQRTGCGLDIPHLRPINQRTKCKEGRGLPIQKGVYFCIN